MTESAAMRKVSEAMIAYAGDGEPTLIEGEAGSGRERIARMLYEMGRSSRRRRGTLAVIDGALAVGDDAAAMDKGSDAILVKRLCELSLSAQRRIESLIGGAKRARPRILATASGDASAAADAGIILRALYDRLAARRIAVPPLRARHADIPRLADGFLCAHAEDLGRERLSLHGRAIDRLLAYPWPGNVAELRHVCRRLTLRVKSTRIRQSDIEAVLPVLANQVPAEDMALEDMVRSKLVAFLRQVDGYPVTGLYNDIVSRIERPLLEVVMTYSDQNQVKAAEILGLNRNTLRRKLTAHGIRAQLRSAPPRTARGTAAPVAPPSKKKA
ncbi:MAG TPA: helix-turn-helix domain-containing protein [Kofleriaceae bacterium]|nr:helix-turn-helix domain-containing protein [Kofleriaceae bacterium]